MQNRLSQADVAFALNKCGPQRGARARGRARVDADLWVVKSLNEKGGADLARPIDRAKAYIHETAQPQEL